MKTTQQWFNETLKDFEKDPSFRAEQHLLDLQEEIINIGPVCGIRKIWFWLMEYSADRLINK